MIRTHQPVLRAAADHRADAARPSRPRDTGSSHYESNNGYAGDVAGVSAVEVETEALRRSRVRKVGRFLKGPIPMRDIAAAARLPGQALAVYLAIHHRQALTKSPSVTLPRSLLTELGITKDAKARALRALEAAELVRVERRAGRSPTITLLIERLQQ